LYLSVALLSFSPESPTVFHEISEKVNANASATWKAAAPPRFGTLEAVKKLCGTFGIHHESYERLPDLLDVDGDFKMVEPNDLPTEFDARTAWPKCSVISKVRDQSDCGSCWAFGSTEAFEDRRCVSSGNDVEFSSDDTAGCCKGLSCGFSMGCNGGQPSAALNWMCHTGVVTGGDFTDIGKGSSCKPYELEKCAHHVAPSPGIPACPTGETSIQCKKSCSESGYTKSYTEDKTKCAKAFSVHGETAIMNSLMQQGPLAVAFTVYSDFPTYKSGVYQHTSGQMLGGHAVEMVGWGTENGTPYWLIKNSWNEDWGDHGYFKIKRGSDECGIESDVSGVSF